MATQLALVAAQPHAFNALLPASDVVVVMEHWDLQLAASGSVSSTCEFSLHSHVLRAQSDYFRDLLPVRTTGPPAHDATRTRLPLKCVNRTLPTSYLKCFNAMYQAHFHGDCVSSLAQIRSVNEALDLLRVATAIRFRAGVQFSLRYIQAATLEGTGRRDVDTYFSSLDVSDPDSFDVVFSCKCELVKDAFIEKWSAVLNDWCNNVLSSMTADPSAPRSGLPETAMTRVACYRIMWLLDMAENLGVADSCIVGLLERNSLRFMLQHFLRASRGPVTSMLMRTKAEVFAEALYFIWLRIVDVLGRRRE